MRSGCGKKVVDERPLSAEPHAVPPVPLTANIGGSQADTISGVISNLRQSPTSDVGDPVASGVPWVVGDLPQTIEMKGAYANSIIGNAPMAATTDTDVEAGALGIARGALDHRHGWCRRFVSGHRGADGDARRRTTETRQYEGALYGLTGALEAAGTWWL